jgi:hypothetical protein
MSDIDSEEGFLKLALIDLLKVLTCSPLVSYLSQTGDNSGFKLILCVEAADCVYKRIATVQ